MDFHTWVFGLFFLAFYAVYVPLQRTPLRLPWLLLASYVFYGWANPRCLVLLLEVTAVDYLVVQGMSRTAWKKPWLLLSVFNDLGVLAYARYSAFLIDNLNWLLAQLGAPWFPPPPATCSARALSLRCRFRASKCRFPRPCRWASRSSPSAR